MTADPCLPETASAAHTTGSTGHHHAVHHVVGRIHHRVRHVQVHAAPAPERVGEACGKHFGPDKAAVAPKAKIVAGGAKVAAAGLLAASALAGSLAAAGALGSAQPVTPRSSLPASGTVSTAQPSPTSNLRQPNVSPSLSGVPVIPLFPESPGHTAPLSRPASSNAGNAVPEPHSVGVLLAALGIVVLARVRRRAPTRIETSTRD